jgi:hypothetical protein
MASLPLVDESNQRILLEQLLLAREEFHARARLTSTQAHLRVLLQLQAASELDELKANEQWKLRLHGVLAQYRRPGYVREEKGRLLDARRECDAELQVLQGLQGELQVRDLRMKEHLEASLANIEAERLSLLSRISQAQKAKKAAILHRVAARRRLEHSADGVGLSSWTVDSLPIPKEEHVPSIVTELANTMLYCGQAMARARSLANQ